ncbi:type II secretion system protein GspM [Hydrogenimonas urashimensis]|uniref:type II secretion system protein GspM n=1 Tax=Hydrogenimonas urashimensis TaxID=2740515 RepID=UPI0019162617|nr:type II secretion system protein GspM [Hydrogenimonas urashimensis]
MLRETESQLEAFPPAKRMALTAGTALMIVALGWYGWIEPLGEQIDAARMECRQLEQKIAAVDLRRIERKLEEVKKRRMELEEKVQETAAAKRYLQSRAKRLDFIWFEQKSFLEMLDRVLKRSVELGLRIDLIESSDDKGGVSPMIERRKRVRIDGAGDFPDIVRLIHYIESFNALLKVEGVKIGLDKKNETLFHLDLVSYGAKL